MSIEFQNLLYLDSCGFGWFLTPKIDFKSKNRNSSTHSLKKKIPLNIYIDSWPKVLLFRTHHLWNSKTILILVYSRSITQLTLICTYLCLDHCKLNRIILSSVDGYPLSRNTASKSNLDKKWGLLSNYLWFPESISVIFLVLNWDSHKKKRLQSEKLNKD